MAGGRFYPFKTYMNDLALTFDGTHKIYPSKMAAFNTSVAANNIISVANAHVNRIIGDIGNIGEYNSSIYNEFRYSIYHTSNEVSSPIIPTQRDGAMQEIGLLGNLIGVADVSMLNHEVYDGIIYAETYLHLSPLDITRWKYFAGVTNIGNAPGINTSIFNNAAINISNPACSGPDDQHKSVTFNLVVIYYNLYRSGSDPTIESAAMAVDMPMGIYVLPEPETLIIESSDLYGSGTSWACRINHKLVSPTSLSLSTGALNLNGSDFSTLTHVMAEFAKLTTKMQQIIDQKNDQISEMRKYLDEFKNQRHVNVPYIIGNHWYVNGKDIGPIVGDITGQIATAVNDALNEDAENGGGKWLKHVPTIKGDPGERGPAGAVGPSCRIDENGYWLIEDFNSREYNADGVPKIKWTHVLDKNENPISALGMVGETGPRGETGPKGDPGTAYDPTDENNGLEFKVVQVGTDSLTECYELYLEYRFKNEDVWHRLDGNLRGRSTPPINPIEVPFKGTIGSGNGSSPVRYPGPGSTLLT